MADEMAKFFETMSNLAKYHREHEKFYARAPLQTAVALHETSGVLKTLADRWSTTEAQPSMPGNPYRGCEDINETATIQHSGVLFLEGEGEPPELGRLKRDLAAQAEDFGQAGEWLDQAMATSWEVVRKLADHPFLADLLGERHRIIANDWQAASLNSLTARLLRRALDILEVLDLAPDTIRDDLRGPRSYPGYLYSAAELVDRAADLAAESAALVHDNERRWRIFRQRVELILTDSESARAGSAVQ